MRRTIDWKEIRRNAEAHTGEWVLASSLTGSRKGQYARKLGFEIQTRPHPQGVGRSLYVKLP